MDKGDTLSASDAEALLGELAEAFLPGVVAGLARQEQPATNGEDYLDDELRYRLLLDQIPAVVFLAPLDRGVGESYVSRSIEVSWATRKRNGWEIHCAGTSGFTLMTARAGAWRLRNCSFQASLYVRSTACWRGTGE